MLALFVLATLLGAIFGALSIGMALIVRHEETLIAIVTGITLPLTFLSTAFMQKSLMPDWMRVAADANPVNWAVEAGREAVSAGTDWGFVASRAGFLLALAILCGASRRARSAAYQRSSRSLVLEQRVDQLEVLQQGAHAEEVVAHPLHGVAARSRRPGRGR